MLLLLMQRNNRNKMVLKYRIKHWLRLDMLSYDADYYFMKSIRALSKMLRAEGI